MNSDSIFLVDAGNTRVKWAWLREHNLQEPGSALHDSFFDLANSILMQGMRPLRVVVSNVAGDEFAKKLVANVKHCWQLQPEFIVPCATAFGVTNAYTDAGKLGADRWATLIAAHHAKFGASCIVDCGTAITIDAITAAGKHLGGVILPGLACMQTALAGNTQGLTYTISDRVANLTPLAQDTDSAISSGSLYAAIAAIDRIVADISTVLEIKGNIITGGDAARLMPLLATHYHFEPNLVLQGLAVIARASA
ncbi:MAG: type III pantothenate kinase [Gammaproteobacteria bacterium]